MAVLWVVAPRNGPDNGGSKYLSNDGNSYQNTRRYNPEDSQLHIPCREDLKPYLYLLLFNNKYS
jgi:hypothetical protein